MRKHKTIAEATLPPVGEMIGYARVSTREQNLDMQIAALERAGCKPVYIQVEKVSAAASHRPRLKWALSNLREGDVFVVWKLDRLARSLPDLIRRVKQIEASGAKLKSLTEEINTATAGGKLLFHVLGALAEFERDLTIERTKAGMDEARKRGVKFGQKRKLTDLQVKEARAAKRKGEPMRLIAKRFRVSYGTVRNWTK